MRSTVTLDSFANSSADSFAFRLAFSGRGSLDQFGALEIKMGKYCLIENRRIGFNRTTRASCQAANQAYAWADQLHQLFNLRSVLWRGHPVPLHSQSLVANRLVAQRVGNTLDTRAFVAPGVFPS